MLKSLFVIACVLLLSGGSVKQQVLNAESDKVEKLTQALIALGKNVDKKEAAHLAKEALTYPKVLAKEYDLVAPANFHNMLINTGFRKRGLCFEWSEDMMTHLKKQNFKTFDFRWGVSHKGGPEEHNSVVAVAKGAAFETGVLLDPWRNSGELFWGNVLKDEEKFQWVEDKKRTTYLGTVNALK